MAVRPGPVGVQVVVAPPVLAHLADIIPREEVAETVSTVVAPAVVALPGPPESPSLPGIVVLLDLKLLGLPYAPVVLGTSALPSDEPIPAPNPAGFTRRSGTQDLMLRGASGDVDPAVVASCVVLGWLSH